ncbi:transmembrane and coiled-coil domain-containing protein 6 isoform X4 [Anopheles sinensis]|uniref:Transmembrane and coiled-coil domain-containing protein 6 isoform X4 n=1 Tax=Anopheles sinensis TaxID=74873 RepID=A0A084WV08_ANOSI|nr:transmembrane and coiled-coil domain-containing protein 6 isoform X4 [Anopheles sinensis]
MHSSPVSVPNGGQERKKLRKRLRRSTNERPDERKGANSKRTYGGIKRFVAWYENHLRKSQQDASHSRHSSHHGCTIEPETSFGPALGGGCRYSSTPWRSERAPTEALTMAVNGPNESESAFAPYVRAKIAKRWPPVLPWGWEPSGGG